MLFKQILGDATNRVSAHLCFASIRVEHLHPGVSFGAGVDQDESVATDPEVPIGNIPGDLGEILGNLFAKTIDINVVVARALHLYESHEYFRDRC